MKNKIYIKYIGAIALIILALISLRVLGKNEKFLNLFAHYYFDQNYYLQHYPEVKEQTIDSFEHYIKYGWREGKNPSKTFETTFYVRQYLYTNKYNLNPLADYVRSKLSFKDPHMINHTNVLKAQLLKNPKYYLTLVAIFQNEASFLKNGLNFID